MTGGGAGLVAGAVAAGVLLILWWRRDRRPLPLLLRVGPYVGIAGTAAPSLARRRALNLPGLRVSVRRLSLPRLAGMSIAAAVGLAAGALVLANGASPLLPLVLAATAGTGAWLLDDVASARRRRRRAEVLAWQLPMLTDLVALAVGAGRSPVEALRESAATLRGPIAEEVDRTVADVQAGAPVEAALGGLADRVALPSMDRFVGALVIAMHTGSPLADVARAQAADVRVEARRRLMESAGRRDALMLVPIVFLVLPCVVAIALYPGLQSLHLVLP